MKKILLFSLLAFFSVSMLEAQETPVPRLKKYDIGDSKCQAYLPAEPETVDISESEDGSTIYSTSVEHGGFTWSVICVRFSEPIDDDAETLNAMLIAYLDFLQSNVLGIEAAVGYGKGHSLASNPNAVGVIDYWQDAEAIQYAVTGWIDSNNLGVLLLSGKSEYPYYNAAQMFKNGFRFPEK